MYLSNWKYFKINLFLYDKTLRSLKCCIINESTPVYILFRILVYQEVTLKMTYMKQIKLNAKMNNHESSIDNEILSSTLRIP